MCVVWCISDTQSFPIENVRNNIFNVHRVQYTQHFEKHFFCPAWWMEYTFGKRKTSNKYYDFPWEFSFLLNDEQNRFFFCGSLLHVAKIKTKNAWSISRNNLHSCIWNVREKCYKATFIKCISLVTAYRLTWRSIIWYCCVSALQYGICTLHFKTFSRRLLVPHHCSKNVSVTETQQK